MGVEEIGSRDVFVITNDPAEMEWIAQQMLGLAPEVGASA